MIKFLADYVIIMYTFKGEKSTYNYGDNCFFNNYFAVWGCDFLVSYSFIWLNFFIINNKYKQLRV